MPSSFFDRQAQFSSQAHACPCQIQTVNFQHQLKSGMSCSVHTTRPTHRVGACHVCILHSPPRLLASSPTGVIWLRLHESAIEQMEQRPWRPNDSSSAHSEYTPPRPQPAPIHTQLTHNSHTTHTILTSTSTSTPHQNLPRWQISCPNSVDIGAQSAT